MEHSQPAVAMSGPQQIPTELVQHASDAAVSPKVMADNPGTSSLDLVLEFLSQNTWLALYCHFLMDVAGHVIIKK